MDGSFASMFMDRKVGASTGHWTKSGQSEEEVQQVLMWASMEVENLRAAAQAQGKLHEARLWRLQQLLETTRKERDEARQECIKLQQRLSFHGHPQSVAIADLQFLLPLQPTFLTVHESPDFSMDVLGDTQSLDLSKLTDDLSKLTEFEPQEFSIEVLDDDLGLDEVDGSLNLAELHEEESLNLPELDENGLNLPELQQTEAANLSRSSSCGSAEQRITARLAGTASIGESTAPIAMQMGQIGEDSSQKFALSTNHLPEPPESDPQVMLSSLPEKGKLLQAVMQAGPLLQTLLLAGPLPQWRHPPPILNSTDIPKVSMSPNTVQIPNFAKTSSPTSEFPTNFAPIQAPIVVPLVNHSPPNLSNYARAGIIASIANNSAPNPCSRSRKLRRLEYDRLNDVQMMM